MKTILFVLVHLVSGNDYQQFVDMKSATACHEMLAKFSTAPVQTINRSETKQPDSSGQLVYACISKERMMEFQDRSEED
jgi:hypothetical protein